MTRRADECKSRAEAWFNELRDRICAVLGEALRQTNGFPGGER